MYVCIFCRTPSGTTFQWSGALITPRGAPNGTIAYVAGAHYAQAARVNAKLRVLGSFLMRGTSTSVFLANGTGASMAPVVPAGGPIAAVGGSGMGPLWSLLLGVFAVPSPQASACVVQNQDSVWPLLSTLQFTAGAVPLEVDPSTGALAPALDDAPYMSGFQLYLEAGDARVLVF